MAEIQLVATAVFPIFEKKVGEMVHLFKGNVAVYKS